MKTVMIVDDEYHSRESLKSLVLKYCTELEVAFEAESVSSACDILSVHTPDLLFLDIMMPDGNGFEILEAFPERSFKVIFITAHDSFAVKAFRFSALDYLLKPVSIAMLKESISKFLNAELSGVTKESMHAANYYFNTHQFDRLIVASQDGYLFIKTDDIVVIEASSSYSIIHILNDKPLFTSKTLLEFEMMLQNHDFYRIHHSHMINLKHIVRYRYRDNCVEMSNGKILSVSARKKAMFSDYCKGLTEPIDRNKNR